MNFNEGTNSCIDCGNVLSELVSSSPVLMVDGGCGKFLVFRVSDIGGSPELLEISLLAKFINNFHPEIF